MSRAVGAPVDGGAAVHRRRAEGSVSRPAAGPCARLIPGLGVLALDVGLELGRLDPPLPPAADLAGGALPGTRERPRPHDAHLPPLRHIGQEEEAWWPDASLARPAPVS